MIEQEYLYIGIYKHINNKKIPTDCKLGVTREIQQRIYQLNRTKSPLNYYMKKIWKIPSTLNREKVEKLIQNHFEYAKYDGCEWFDIELNEFYVKLSKYLELLNEMFLSKSEYKFEEITEEITEEINKKTKPTRLKLTTNEGLIIYELTSRDTFIKCLEHYGSIFGIEEISTCLNLVNDVNDINPQYKNTIVKFGDFYYHTNTNTKHKYSEIKQIIETFNINDVLEIIN